MQANLEEVRNLVTQLTFLDKIRLLEFLAPLIARSAPTVDTHTLSDAISESTSTPSYSVHPNRDAMRREIDAYNQMHSKLVTTHLNEYVSLFQGEVVDHDEDPVALHRRIKAKFPNRIVLSRKVTTDPERVINMRSPRVERVP